MTLPSPSTEWIPATAALERVLTHERSTALARRLLVQAWADDVRTRGYLVQHWPPYREGAQELSRELWTAYPPQHGPARIDWAEGSAVMQDGHPHAACTVYGLEVSAEDLAARWPAPLAARPPKTRKPSIRTLVKQAEASGKPVTAITMPDGVKLEFDSDPAKPSANPWLADLRTKETKQ